MSDFDLVIRHGEVATASDVMRADVGIRDGAVVALGRDLAPGREELDASGKLVLPGGVDAHVHLDQPTGNASRMADDFESGTRSAAFGGTTTVIPFACQMRGQSLRAAVDDYHRRADGRAYIDYAFHLIITDPTPQVIGQELPTLIRDGYTSFKIYMTYDDLKLNDYQILEVLALARREGAMTMIHAENADCIQWLTERLEAAGQTAPYYHGPSRPYMVEREATHRAITLSEVVDVPVLIVHVSGAEAMEQIHLAQGRGLRVYAETCPQYLHLSAEDLGGEDFAGARCVCSPPPRDPANQQAIWHGIENGTFTVFSSDHAPFRFEGPEGKQFQGKDAAFKHIPNGIPGVETRLPLLFGPGVKGGRIDLCRFVALTATNPAKLYGLYPRKGTIAIGSDADIAIWDPAREVTIQNAMLHHNVDYTPYEGITVSGWPDTVLSRGRIVCQAGSLRGRQGDGRFLPCELPAPARPRPTL